MEFKNLKDLFTKLSDENAARRHMEFMRWGDAPFCPHCNSTKPYKLKDGKTYRCKGNDISVYTRQEIKKSGMKMIEKIQYPDSKISDWYRKLGSFNTVLDYLKEQSNKCILPA